MNTEIDFSASEYSIREKIKYLLSKGADPVELCIRKWKYIIYTGDNSPGKSPDTCALCIKFNYEGLGYKACLMCPLSRSGNGYLNKGSSYDKYSRSIFNKMKYAKEMLNSLESINKNEEKKLSGVKTLQIRLLEEKLNKSDIIIKNLRNRLINHLNYTKFAILGLIFIPWLSFTFYSFISQIVTVGNSLTGKFDYIKTVHDPVSAYAFYAGIIGTTISLLVSWYCAWLFWKEEHV